MTTYVFRLPRIRTQRIAFLLVYPVLAGSCLLISLCDIASLHNAIPSMFTVGDLGIDWTIIPALALLLWFSSNAFIPFKLNLQRAMFMGIFLGVCLGSFVLYTRATHSAGNALGFLLLGLKEEAVYRVALPIAIAFLFTTIGISRKWAFRSSIILSALVFMTLPGHLAQVQRWPELLVFGAFALIMSYFTWECGAVIFAGVLHASMNVITELERQGSASVAMRVGVVFILVMALTAALPTRQEAAEESPDNDDDGVVIDLRDHVLAQQKAAELQKTGN